VLTDLNIVIIILEKQNINKLKIMNNNKNNKRLK
jgi:hypothetical protein